MWCGDVVESLTSVYKVHKITHAPKHFKFFPAFFPTFSHFAANIELHKASKQTRDIVKVLPVPQRTV